MRVSECGQSVREEGSSYATKEGEERHSSSPFSSSSFPRRDESAGGAMETMEEVWGRITAAGRAAVTRDIGCVN